MEKIRMKRLDIWINIELSSNCGITRGVIRKHIEDTLKRMGFK